MAGKKIQNWAFVAPKMSRDLSEYFKDILDFIKDDPSVFVHAFTFEDPNIAMLAALRTSNEPIKALVSRAGFGDMSQATRAFKSRFGLTMNEYQASL